ncbi:hypothetical protein NT6N_19250 [Oceaniferula spumae]|uniref:Arylsulfatase n=1 Tax=Oceaniferula spumae TaxID=2979115 RepID=A0AAT9FLN6_9BACT
MKKSLPFLLALTLSCGHADAAPRPNIILVMADDMGWGDPGYNSTTVTYADGTPHPDQGWISTPTMDTMAANGLRFDRFYAASAVCSPTRASCLLGRNPFRAGVPTANSGRMEFDETPLSEVLAGAGYTCGHFGKWHLGVLTTLTNDANRGGPGSENEYSAPWHHGYDVCYVTESKVPTYHPYRKANNSAALPTSFSDSNFYGSRYWRMPAAWNETSGEGDAVPVNEVNDAFDGDDSKLIVDQAIPFIQGAVAQGKPFFVVVWFHTPHKPTTDPDGTSAVDSPDTVKDSIEDLDTALGRLRDELTTLGVRGNTMLWVTSDNGPEDGQDSANETDTVRSIRSGRLLERKRSLHEGGLRVPGILEWPDVITSGITTNVPASTSDYYPTILDYLELSVPNQKPLDGISLRPFIEGTATERTKPIGFKFSGDHSWVNQQYKLINDGSGWELYDLINIPAGEEPEQSALATAANVGTKPQAVQNIYNTMLAEFNAWNATLSPDTPYVHSSQPTVVLSTPSGTVDAPFVVTATFNEAVTQLHANEFVVSNGTASGLSGSGTTWTVTITPGLSGAVTIDLPEGCAIDAYGNPNGQSNQLSVSYTDLRVHEVVTLVSTAGQTVDSNGTVDATSNGSNNDEKFTAGTINDGVANPYTTPLFVRGNGVDATHRVSAYTRFNLSALTGHPIISASLNFNGHSLNEGGAVDIQLSALAVNWAETGPPAPTYSPAIYGEVVSGGSIITNLEDSNHTKDYSVDVTTIVRNWTDGVWQNYGILFQLSSDTSNNGLGIKTSGEGALELTVEVLPFKVNTISADTDGDITLEWNSIAGASYRIEANDDLDPEWEQVAMVTGSPGEHTSYTHIEGMIGFDRRFYRVVFLSH